MRASRALALSFLIWTCAGRADQSCMLDLANLFRPATAKTLAEKAGAAVSRELSDKEVEAVEKAKRLTEGEVYTPGEVEAQNKLLKKAGMSADEISDLRKSGVLGNSVVSFANGAPSGLEAFSLPLREISSADLKLLRSGQDLNYVIGEEGKLFVMEGKLPFSPGKLAMVEGGSDAVREGTIVREAGKVIFDSKTKQFKFKPRYGFENNDEFTKELVRMKFGNGAEKTFATESRIPPSRAFKCLDAVSAQYAGKGMVFKRWMVDNAVTVGTIAAWEPWAHRLDTKLGTQIVVADVLGGAINGFIGNYAGKAMVQQGLNARESFLARALTGQVLAQTQNGVTRMVVDEPPEKAGVSDKVYQFNAMHSYYRLVASHYFDKAMMNSVPSVLFNLCSNHPTASLFINQHTIRFAERVGSGVLYYGARQKIVGQ